MYATVQPWHAEGQPLSTAARRQRSQVTQSKHSPRQTWASAPVAMPTG
jgi:hypothetical protein